MRERRVRGIFQIPKFTEDSELCPVHALSTYFTKVTSASLEVFSDYSLISLQVSGICGDKKFFFVSYVKPHRSVTAKTLARWRKVMLTDASVDPKLWAPHAVRSASSTHHSTVRNLDLGQICHLAGCFMASKTYLRFYQCYV